MTTMSPTFKIPDDLEGYGKGVIYNSTNNSKQLRIPAKLRDKLKVTGTEDVQVEGSIKERKIVYTIGEPRDDKKENE